MQQGDGEKAVPRPWHRFYFRAFDALMYDRFIGAMGGEGPIYYQAMSRYAADKGLTGEDLDMFEIFMNSMDGEYLAIRREQSEKHDAEDAAKKAKR